MIWNTFDLIFNILDFKYLLEYLILILNTNIYIFRYNLFSYIIYF